MTEERFTDLPTKLRNSTERMAHQSKQPFGLWNTHSNHCLDAALKIEALEREVAEWADTAGTATANLHRMRQGRGVKPDDGPHEAILS